jgi:hypothetical protein
VAATIAVTPAVFRFNRPQGQDTLHNGSGPKDRGTLNRFGDLVQTTFRL